MTARGKSDNRQIRVFISSTFRDMQAERDHLVKFIFPQLRKLCESRGVTWGEVDLRWGVTDEQAAEGKVLPICLEEIKRCRPYFIGLLGERYGWIPDALPDDLLEHEPWLKEHLHVKTSVTELEILHGVLLNPQMAGHAFFYFRDPAYVNSIPEKDRKDFTAENAKDAEKLSSLKENIRHSEFPVRENYPDPKALGELVLADLTKVINDLWPEGSQPDPLDREAMDHEAYAQSRERVYIGRQEYYDRLDAYASGSVPRPQERERVAEGRVSVEGGKQIPAGDSSPSPPTGVGGEGRGEVGMGNTPLVILGESGSGKSALLANWVARYRQTHPDALVLQHYIGATPYSADWAAMLRRLMGEFKRRLGLQQDIPDQPDALRSAFPNWLYMAAASLAHPMGEGGRRPGEGFNKIVIVLDALNQLEDRDGAPDLVWLPPVLPENVRLIVSTLPGRPLDEIQKRNWPTLKVELLSADERRKLIAEYLAQHAKALNAARVERIAAAPPSANPLYLRVLLDELRLVRTHEELEERIGDYLKADSPYALYEKVIARWEQDYEGDSDMVGDTLSLLWAARRGLTETELLQALGKDGEPLPRAKSSPLFLAMSDALISHGGLLTFAHDFLRTAVENAYLPTEQNQQRAHIRLADYFEHQPANSHRTDELPWQLAKVHAWQRLRDLLADRAFFTEAWRRNPLEVKNYWTQIEAGSPLRMVEAYCPQIECPEAEEDKHYLLWLSDLLDGAGHPFEAFALLGHMVDYFRQVGNLQILSILLCTQASILQEHGDWDRAMALFKEAEPICRQFLNLNNPEATRTHVVEQVNNLIKIGSSRIALHVSLLGMAEILQARGDLDGAMALLKESERVHRQMGNVGELPMILLGQARVLRARGDWDGGMALLEEAGKIFRQLGEPLGLQAVVGNQALILRARGDLDGAMALHKEAEQICRQLGTNLTATFCNQAEILRERGDLDGAMALHKEAEQICRQLRTPAALEGILGNQAGILEVRGNLDGAMALLKEQEQICRQLGKLDGLSNSLGSQGLIMRARGDLDMAMELLKESERISRQAGNLNSLESCLGNQGLILRDRGDLGGAMALFKEQERICRQLGKLRGLKTTLLNQALILKTRGDLDGAMLLLEEQRGICRKLGNLSDLQQNLGRQLEILFARQDWERAMPLLVEEERICRQLGNLDMLEATLNNQAGVLLARGDLDGAMRLQKEVEQICRKLGKIDGLIRSLANQASVLLQMKRAIAGLPLVEEANQLATMHGYSLWVRNLEPLLVQLRQAAQSQGSGESVAHETVHLTPFSSPRETSISELRDSAATALKRGLWEGAETCLEKLLQQGEPVGTVAPDLITALLNAHETLSPATVTRIETLLTQLASAGHTALAQELRTEFTAKLETAKPKKSHWKIW